MFIICTITLFNGIFLSMENATIKDVASAAGVSIGTVSRFLNGYKIKEGNRKAVEKAIKDLNYRTDHLARSMKTGKSSTVGLIISGYDQFNTGVQSTMVKLFREEGYTLVTYHHEDKATIFDNVFSFFMDRQFDGIALSGLDCRLEQVQEYLDMGKAVAVFNNDVPGLDLDRVMVNNEEATFEAISYLIQMNHRRIAFFTGNMQDSTAQNRLNGYKRALEENGMPFDESLVIYGNWNDISGYLGLKELMRHDPIPSAIFTSNYLMAVGVMKAARELSLGIPEDLSLVSFDDPDFFDILSPPVTSIAQPTREVGRQISEFLLDRITGRYSGPGRELQLRCRLILRNSVSYCD
jgi:LacI family transcriptional regulator